MTGYCEDCGNTACICSVDDLPSPDPIASAEYVMVPKHEYEMLESDLAAARAALAAARLAMAELLSAHDNLYVAYFGGMMPPGVETDPTVDIAAKPARAMLATEPDAWVGALMLVVQSAEAFSEYAGGVDWKAPCQGPIRLMELCEALDRYRALVGGAGGEPG